MKRINFKSLFPFALSATMLVPSCKSNTKDNKQPALELARIEQLHKQKEKCFADTRDSLYKVMNYDAKVEDSLWAQYNNISEKLLAFDATEYEMKPDTTAQNVYSQQEDVFLEAVSYINYALDIFDLTMYVGNFRKTHWDENNVLEITIPSKNVVAGYDKFYIPETESFSEHRLGILYHNVHDQMMFAYNQAKRLADEEFFAEYCEYEAKERLLSNKKSDLEQAALKLHAISTRADSIANQIVQEKFQSKR